MGLEKKSEQVGIDYYLTNPLQNTDFVQKHVFVNYTEQSQSQDSNLSKYLNEKAISEMIKVNSEVRNILGALKIPIKINLKILNNLTKNHLPQTRKIALGIAHHLPQNYKFALKHKALCEATSLHDIAKVIIPESIINKEGSLNEQEREIMEKHATLSYELLKNTDLSKDTLDLIKNHHHALEEGCNSDINLQILSMADIYSALREKRSYKPAMSRESSLKVIYDEVIKGKFDKEIYSALVEFSKIQESAKFNFNWKIFNLKLINSFSA